MDGWILIIAQTWDCFYVSQQINNNNKRSAPVLQQVIEQKVFTTIGASFQQKHVKTESQTKSSTCTLIEVCQYRL